MHASCAHEMFDVRTPARLFIPLTQIGEGVEEALLPDVGWHVLAVFQRSFYLQNKCGDLICVGPLQIGSGPLNALYRFPLELNWQDIGLRVDTPVNIDGTKLNVGDRFVFDVLGAAKWRPPAIGHNHAPEAIASGLSLLTKCAIQHAPRDSLGYLIAGLLEKGEPENTGPVGMSVFQRACFNAASDLKTWLVKLFGGQVFHDIPPGIKSLLGLGPGLTPSGDDLLGGAFIAMHSLGRADLRLALWDWLQPATQHRTTTISQAHLNWAARGSGAAAIHILISSLLRSNTQELTDCLKAVGRMGHTSGWDTLAGIALVWISYMENQDVELRRS